eukprot:Amastigsp_a2020_32.p3 type:complete len:288 gc:universal Amastigsp_a2020_32:2655-3518(+)
MERSAAVCADVVFKCAVREPRNVRHARRRRAVDCAAVAEPRVVAQKHAIDHIDVCAGVEERAAAEPRRLGHLAVAEHRVADHNRRRRADIDTAALRADRKSLEQTPRDNDVRRAGNVHPHTLANAALLRRVRERRHRDPQIRDKHIGRVDHGHGAAEDGVGKHKAGDHVEPSKLDIVDANNEPRECAAHVNGRAPVDIRNNRNPLEHRHRGKQIEAPVEKKRVPVDRLRERVHDRRARRRRREAVVRPGIRAGRRRCVQCRPAHQIAETQQRDSQHPCKRRAQHVRS